MTTKPPIDLLLIGALLSFAVTSFVFDPFTALDVDLATATSIPGRLNYWFASEVDPLLLDPPWVVQIMVGISVVILGPAYLFLAYGLWHRRPWLKPLAYIYAGVKTYSMIVYLGVALFGDTHPRNYVLFTLVYLPYLVVPLMLAARVRSFS